MKQLLAVEINGQCQLHCPHCYIDKEDWPKTLMSGNIIDQLPVGEYKQIAIVATEPFFNRASLEATVRLGRRVSQVGKQFSVITNALGLAHALKLEPELASLLSWIDISMDVPGEESYKEYRGSSWQKFQSGVKAAQTNGIEISILNTVSQVTLPHFEEMIRTSDSLSTDFFTVSLMLSADSRETAYLTSPVASIKNFLEMCAASSAFRKSKKVRLDIGQTICKQSGESIEELESYAERLNISEKAVFFFENPDSQIDRVTVAGEFILPSQTLKAAQK